MNIAIWILAGSILGWAGYAFLAANEARGALASIIIGAIGGMAGGKLLGPLLGASGNEFSLLSLAVAIVGATAFLAIGNLISVRYDV